MFKKLLGLTAATFMAFTSINAQATLVQHDIYLDNVSGNAFGISDGFEGVIGFLEYNTYNAVFDNEIDAENDPMFNFGLNLGGTEFTMADDIFGDAFAIFEFPETYEGLLNNLMVFFAELEDVDGNFAVIDYDTDFGANFFDAFDSEGNGIFGEISLVNTVVPAPPMFALMVMGLFAVRRLSK